MLRQLEGSRAVAETVARCRPEVISERVAARAHCSVLVLRDHA